MNILETIDLKSTTAQNRTLPALWTEFHLP